jgi:hypothetical protein
MEILQLHALKSCLHRLPYRTDLVVSVFFLGMDHVEVHRFQNYLYSRALILCCENVFTEPLPRNVCSIFAYIAVVAE